jgi:hypothetical protein
VRTALLYNQRTYEGRNLVIRLYLHLHWWIAWLVLLVGVYAMARFAHGFLHGAIFGKRDRLLIKAFRGLMDLQGTLGLAFYLTNGFSGIGFPGNRTLHGILMAIAIVIAHVFTGSGNGEDQTLFLNNFYGLLAAFMVMIVALSALGG